MQRSGNQRGCERSARYSNQAWSSASPPSCCHGNSPSRQSWSKAGYPSGRPAIPGSREVRRLRPPQRAGRGHPARPIPDEGGDFPRKPGPTPLAPRRCPLGIRDPPTSAGAGGSPGLNLGSLCSPPGYRLHSSRLKDSPPTSTGSRWGDSMDP